MVQPRILQPQMDADERRFAQMLQPQMDADGRRGGRVVGERRGELVIYGLGSRYLLFFSG